MVCIASAGMRLANRYSPVWPADQAMIDHALATARSTIGADTFAAVWAEAQSLPVEQILNRLPSVAAFTAVRDR